MKPISNVLTIGSCIFIVAIMTTKKDFIIYTTDGFLKITCLQFPGKKKMQAHELLNGITFTENAVAQ